MASLLAGAESAGQARSYVPTGRIVADSGFRQGRPTQVLNALTRALNEHKETYTLAIIKADGSGGHAITPIAVEDRGNGQAAIIVYDNNFPGILRAVDVNTNNDTWHYVGGINPSDTGEIYDGNAQTKSMLLLPTSVGERTQPCPFCAPKSSGPGAPTAIDKLHYVEVAITAKAAEHPHLLFTDAQGRKTGFVRGKLVAQIPGIQVVQNYSVKNWSSAPEPTYHLPLGHPLYTVTVDGSNVTRPIKTQLQVNGAGLVFYIQDIHMAPGQQEQCCCRTTISGSHTRPARISRRVRRSGSSSRRSTTRQAHHSIRSCG